MAITPSTHEKSEWARLAKAAQSKGRADVVRTFEIACMWPEGQPMPVAKFDELQEVYRAWLVGGFLDQVQVSRALLERAESFIAGFEDDDVQGPEGLQEITEVLAGLRAAIGA